MRIIVLRFLLIGLLLFASPLSSTAADTPQLFTSEQDAQQHCPNDVIVWLNLKSGIYHLQRERWYGNTKNGAFVCKSEADQAGDRETRNGQ